ERARLAPFARAAYDESRRCPSLASTEPTADATEAVDALCRLGEYLAEAEHRGSPWRSPTVDRERQRASAALSRLAAKLYADLEKTALEPAAILGDLNHPLRSSGTNAWADAWAAAALLSPSELERIDRLAAQKGISRAATILLCAGAGARANDA